MYRKVSLLYGGSITALRRKLNWGKSHGPVKIKMADGRSTDIQLPGNLTLNEPCEHCGDMVYLMGPLHALTSNKHIFRYRRQYGLFCGENCARSWLREHRIADTLPVTMMENQ